MRELSSSGFDYAALEPLTTPEEQVVLLLLDALRKLADTGQVDAACRIAGQACVALRPTNVRSERRFNALLHHLTRRLEPIERGNL